MGNEMGNNNVTGSQVSDEAARGVDKIIEPLDASPMLSNVTGSQVSDKAAQGVDKIIEPLDASPMLSTNNDEKDGTEDVDMSKSLKDPIISDGGDEKVLSDQKNSSTKIEDLDHKNMGSLQDDTSTQDDDQNSNLPTERETAFPVNTTIKDMTINKDSSPSDEKIQIVDGTRRRSEERTIANSSSLLGEDIEGSLEDEEESGSHEVALVDGKLVGQDTIENLEQGHTEVSTAEHQLMPIQGETTSSNELIITDYLDADDSEIKEVVMEDEPRERNSSPSVQPVDGANLETSTNYKTEIPEEKEEISDISKTTTVETVIESDEVLEEDKIHGLNQDEDNPKCIACGPLDIGEVVSKLQSSLTDPSATNERELEKHELNEGVVAARKITDSVTATVQHNGIEKTHMEEEVIVDKAVAVQNLADNFEGKKEPEESDGMCDLFSLIQVNGKNFTELDSSLSDYLPLVKEEKVQTEVNEEALVATIMVPTSVTGILECDKETVKESLEQDENGNNAGVGLHIDAQVVATEGGDLSNLPMTVPSDPLQFVQDFRKKGDKKFDSSDSNEATITSTDEAKTGDTQETMTTSQCDQSHQILLDEPEVVKLESSEILSTCTQSVEDSSKTGIAFTNGSNHEKASATATAIGFAFESNQEKVTVTATAVGFTAESNYNKVIASTDKATEERYLLQTPSPGRDTGEDTPLLHREEGLSSFSYSTEQHSIDIPMTDIAVMQIKAEAEEESDKSPLLSPREPSEGDFRAPNHSAKNKRLLQSLMTEDRVGMWPPLKEQQPLTKNNAVV